MLVRRATLADISAMVRLALESPGAAHWSAQQYRELFEKDEAGGSERLILVMENFPASGADAASIPDSKIIASLVAQRVDTEWELENIVVAEEFRRRGIGRRLLTEFMEHARGQSGRAIFLEVRESNQSARALYGRLGFEAAGVRKAYYSNPLEDAVLYRRAL